MFSKIIFQMFKNALHNNNAYINNRRILLNYIRNEYLNFYHFHSLM